MTAQCTPHSLSFHNHGRRQVLGRFDGGQIVSDGGGVLLREVDRCVGMLTRLGRCFQDYRNPNSTEHAVGTMVSQRVCAQALGYEDLNDHGDLRRDWLLALLAGRKDVTGAKRTRRRDRGAPLASSSTLNRLELSVPEAAATDRYKRIVAKPAAMDALMLDLFLESQSSPPPEVWLDLDATDDPLHGNQEGRFFHGYYKNFCYLPLYVFSGEHLLLARLRRSNLDASAGSVEEVERIVARLRGRWPRTRFILRGDSGFCREPLMRWCEGHGVNYLFGLARNERLTREIESEMREARAESLETGEAARRFRDFEYRTTHSWSASRRVVGKAEHLPGKANPRFVVTNLGRERADARELYEKLYCARGDMENRIKEQQLALFADRTSCATIRANQLRLYLASFAYILMQSLRRLGLEGTDYARAQCATIRLKFLKIGARIKVTSRKIWLSFSETYPHADVFHQVLRNLQSHPPWFESR